MSIKQGLALLLAMALTACSAIQTNERSEGVPRPAYAGREVRFLRPLDVKFVLSRTDPMRPQLCRQLPGHSQCPPILTGGWTAGGGIPTIEPAFQADLPNVRASFVVQDISNEVVAGGGVETMGGDVSFVNWFTTSTAADVEQTGPFAWSLPEPGETWQDISHFGGGGGLLIYDALVLNACNTFSSFPIEHTVTIVRQDGTELGEFQGIDNSTLDATGFYNLSYSVRAEDEDGGVSDFHFSGKVNVTCSGLNSL